MSGLRPGHQKNVEDLEIIQETLDSILMQLQIMNELLKGILQ